MKRKLKQNQKYKCHISTSYPRQGAIISGAFLGRRPVSCISNHQYRFSLMFFNRFEHNLSRVEKNPTDANFASSLLEDSKRYLN